jgi:hypothetical protein
MNLLTSLLLGLVAGKGENPNQQTHTTMMKILLGMNPSI